jgi:hypothetical protein
MRNWKDMQTTNILAPRDFGGAAYPLQFSSCVTRLNEDDE